MGVAFIDESVAWSVPSYEVIEGIEDMRQIVLSLAPPTKELLVFPIESLFSSASTDGKDQLSKLLDGVSDTTGKEDLLIHLRMLSLQKVRLKIKKIYAEEKYYPYILFVLLYIAIEN